MSIRNGAGPGLRNPLFHACLECQGLLINEWQWVEDHCHSFKLFGG